MMQVVKATSGEWTVNSPSDTLFKVGTLIRPQFASLTRNFLKARQREPLSPAILPSRWPVCVNMSDAEIVHLHWLNAEKMSVEGVGSIQKPVVWTLHDMWAFAERGIILPVSVGVKAICRQTVHLMKAGST